MIKGSSHLFEFQNSSEITPIENMIISLRSLFIENRWQNWPKFPEITCNFFLPVLMEEMKDCQAQPIPTTGKVGKLEI